MNNNIQPIRTYQELVKEEQRLTLLVQWHRDQLRGDVDEVKKQFSTVARVIGFIRHPLTLLKERSLPGVGVSMGVGMLAVNIARRVGGGLLQRLFNKKKGR
jgi:hypothetical protein